MSKTIISRSGWGSGIGVPNHLPQGLRSGCVLDPIEILLRHQICSGSETTWEGQTESRAPARGILRREVGTTLTAKAVRACRLGVPISQTRLGLPATHWFLAAPDRHLLAIGGHHRTDLARSFWHLSGWTVCDSLKGENQLWRGEQPLT